MICSVTGKFWNWQNLCLKADIGICVLSSIQGQVFWSKLMWVRPWPWLSDSTQTRPGIRVIWRKTPHTLRARLAQADGIENNGFSMGPNVKFVSPCVDQISWKICFQKKRLTLGRRSEGSLVKDKMFTLFWHPLPVRVKKSKVKFCIKCKHHHKHWHFRYVWYIHLIFNSFGAYFYEQTSIHIYLFNNNIFLGIFLVFFYHFLTNTLSYVALLESGIDASV